MPNHPRHTIYIPDAELSIPIDYKGKIWFTFTLDENKFSTDHPEYFSPPLPAGGFPSGTTIGPYTAIKSASDVHFDYDNGNPTTRPMHTIHIGN